MIKKDFWLSCGTIIALSLGIALPLKPAIGQSSTAVPIRMIALVSHQGNNRIAFTFLIPILPLYRLMAEN